MIVLSSLVAGEVSPAGPGPVEWTEKGDHYPLSADLAVYPPPDGWIREASVAVSVRLLNQSSSPILSTVSLSLDGLPLRFDWDAQERVVLGEPSDPLSDGLHAASLSLRYEDGGGASADWSFSIDTKPPIVTLEPLSEEVETRLLWVKGRVVEENLLNVHVNGFAAIVEDDAFRVPVLLWPGLNELEAVAVDLAGNRGLGVSRAQWLPAPPSNQTYELVAHMNSSFVMRLPSSWTILRDFQLEGGAVADILAYPSGSSSSFNPSVAVLSLAMGQAVSEGLFMGVLESTVRNLAERSEVEVIASPRFIESATNALAAQASLLESRDFGPRIFVSVTGFWNSRVQRIWLVIGSLPTDRLEGEWHAIQTAVETFTVLEPAPPTEGPLGPPDVSVIRALLVTVGGIAFVSLVFLMALYSRRLGARRRRQP